MNKHSLNRRGLHGVASRVTRISQIALPRSRSLVLIPALMLLLLLVAGCNASGLPIAPTAVVPATSTPVALASPTAVAVLPTGAPTEAAPTQEVDTPEATATSEPGTPSVIVELPTPTRDTGGGGGAQPTVSPAATFAPLDASQRAQVFEQVWQTVKDNYIYRDFRGLDWQKMHDQYKPQVISATSELDAYNLIADMIDKLNDGHSAFVNPQQAAEDDAMRTGNLQLSGIGVLTQELDKAIRVVYVIPGGPADKSGIRAWDTILAANGVPIKTANDAPRLIRGVAGSTVVLTIQTPGQSSRQVPVVREQVTFTFAPDVSRWPGTNVVYLNLLSFDVEGISDETQQALQAAAGKGPVDGLIIDLRQNGGGLLSEEHAILSLFLNGGNAGYDLTLNGREKHTIPSGRVMSAYKGKPIVILVSKASESASERFAAVMQDYKRATILGTPSAGNTETVYPHDIVYGSRLMLAQATWVRTDGKTSIEDKGVQPDVLLDVPWYNSPPDQDPQILAAIKKIEGK